MMTPATDEREPVDPKSGLWLNRYNAVHSSGVLESAPLEYIEVLPWQIGPDGDQWISRSELSRWVDGGDFYNRADAVIQAREDAEYRAFEAGQ